MKKEMLINVLQPEECRIAIVENGILEELYVERTSHESYTGNIYKGKIVNLEPAIQAAFVDFSVGRNGFLHVSDVEPQYYMRHQPASDEGELPGTGGPGPRPREPRRDRDREERRRPRPEPIGDPFALPPPPPRGEERNRERERDRDRDRDRERERPDRSVRGRRDRSEMPRRFGEGLADDPDAQSNREPAAEPMTPAPKGDDSPIYGTQQSSRADWPELPDRGWEEDLEGGRERERPHERPFGDEEPAGPRWRSARSTEPFDPDLPPSRTQRGRPYSAPVPPDLSEPEVAGRYHTGAAAPEAPGGDRGMSFGEGLTPEPPAPREPRRGRGRGRSSQPPATPRPPAGFDEEPLDTLDVETGRGRLSAPEPFSPVADEPSYEPPRRRGGRAAIRSRGGERGGQAEGPQDAPAGPLPERPSRPAAEPEAERYRPADLPRAFDSARGRSGDTAEPTRERTRPHSRAGEPGYVPRRERLRSADQAPPAEPEFASFDWQDRAHEPDPDIESREFLAGDEESVGPESSAPRGEGRDPRRRRRRRGRRRERERPELETAREAETDDLAPEYPEMASEAEFPSEFGRGLSAEEFADVDLEDFDLEIAEAEEAGEAIDDDELLAPEGRGEVMRIPEEEIDPELEQEIRKEIEEIEELEREMGLRGPVEARPRRGDDAARTARGGRGRGMAKPPIQEIFRRGDEVLVQVIKESIGTKGPTLSTYISIPGRYLVLMPGLNRVGVSRKIVDEGQRRKLREIMHELNPPKGLGFIVRTAGLERSKRELARDLAYLLRLWKVILRRIKRTRGTGPIYQESDMITRTIRDIFTSEIDTIWIDEPAAFERAQEFLRVVMPRFVNRIKLYEEKVPLFYKYGIEDEIAKIQRRHVPLPEGGSVVIDQTEALVAIDVNSGNFRVEDDAEKTAYEMNLRAAKEIARQLRLRDLGGVIVNDFIDMREERHRRGVERALRDAIKRDRARTKILRMSAFGLIEMTRQRIRPSLKRSVYEDCSHCAGAGVVKTAESMSIDVMRLLALASHREDIRRITITVNPSVATYLNNRKRKEIARLETESGMTVLILIKENAPAEHLQLECFDANNSEVRLVPLPLPGHKRGH